EASAGDEATGDEAGEEVAAADAAAEAAVASEEGDLSWLDEPPAEDTGKKDGFSRFLKDLTEYLNSSDYLNDFMFDSLRVAGDLATETLDLVASRAAEELRQNAGQLRESLELDRRRLDALEKLEQSAWSDAFSHLYDAKRAMLEESSSEPGRRLGGILQEQVDAWMKSDESWNELRTRLNAQIEREAANNAEALISRTRALVDNPQGGARFDAGQQENFRVAGLHVDEIARRLLPNLGGSASASALQLQIDREELPVRRTLGDILLLRGRKQS